MGSVVGLLYTFQILFHKIVFKIVKFNIYVKP